MIRPFLSVIIPAHNAAETLPILLIDADRFLSEQEFSYEILVINDCSTDRTHDIVTRMAPAIRNLKLIDNPDRRGIGAAAKVGMFAARGDWRLVADARNLVPIAAVVPMLPHLTGSDSYDILVGKGRASGSFTFSQRLLHACARLVIGSRLTGIPFGFYSISLMASEKLFTLIKTESASYLYEMIALGNLVRYRIQEVPFTDAGGAFVSEPLLSGLQTIWETLKIRWRMTFKRYAPL